MEAGEHAEAACRYAAMAYRCSGRSFQGAFRGRHIPQTSRALKGILVSEEVLTRPHKAVGKAPRHLHMEALRFV